MKYFITNRNFYWGFIVLAMRISKFIFGSMLKSLTPLLFPSVKRIPVLLTRIAELQSKLEDFLL